MTAPQRTVRIRITGEVQGVGYRIWATRTASTYGLRGWVRNRFDGSVEALATGAPEAIAAFVEACWQGPRAAQVNGVTLADAEDHGSFGFSARPTE
jgi:acylphosphatase